MSGLEEGKEGVKVMDSGVGFVYKWDCIKAISAHLIRLDMLLAAQHWRARGLCFTTFRLDPQREESRRITSGIQS